MRCVTGECAAPLLPAEDRPGPQELTCSECGAVWSGRPQHGILFITAQENGEERRYALRFHTPAGQATPEPTVRALVERWRRLRAYASAPSERVIMPTQQTRGATDTAPGLGRSR